MNRKSSNGNDVHIYLGFNMASNGFKWNIFPKDYSTMTMQYTYSRIIFRFFLQFQKIYTQNMSSIPITHFMTQDGHHIYTRAHSEDTSGTFPRSRYSKCTSYDSPLGGKLRSDQGSKKDDDHHHRSMFHILAT